MLCVFLSRMYVVLGSVDVKNPITNASMRGLYINISCFSYNHENIHIEIKLFSFIIPFMFMFCCIFTCLCKAKHKKVVKEISFKCKFIDEYYTNGYKKGEKNALQLHIIFIFCVEFLVRSQHIQ